MRWLSKHKVVAALLIVFLVLVLLALCAFGYVMAKLDLIVYDDEVDKSVYTVSTEATGETQPTEEEQTILSGSDVEGLEQVEVPPTIPVGTVEQKDEVVNILLIGTDERTKKFNSFARSDSMIIVSINKNDKTVKLVSLERGMGVPILEGQYKGQYDWLTQIFQYGGADLLVRTVEECFLVDIDNYVRLNFTSVKSVIETIGGVEVELTYEEVKYLNHALHEISSSQETLHTGVNRLDGPTALAYARLREIDSDWYRVKRQRKVILGVVEELKGSSLLELNALADEVLPMVQTDLTPGEIMELVLYAPNFLKSEFDQTTIPHSGTYGNMIGLKGRSLFAVDFEANAKILHDFLYGTDTEK
ncbi:MAG: LCP family protein [Oscillospiraceae bacterium]|nr:LCP family protein [Oscillospiraceae bacterium]